MAIMRVQMDSSEAACYAPAIFLLYIRSHCLSIWNIWHA